jgi:Tol biopolymer transport system component/predicted Ser/Thr protein kinase
MLLSVGDKLGPYEILAQIGVGGMGEVYKARDTRLDRLVALKVSKSEFSARFEREARAISALNHPNICTLYDIGPNYLVMEFVDAKPLLSPEKPGPLRRDEVLRLAGQIADALDHAHRAGVVHRDLKPANILVNKNGVKVLDFGLAKLDKDGIEGLSDETKTLGLTQQGAIMGTLQYMSPEQAEGQPADARSDIFSFGAVLYEMLTGKKAFKSAASTIVAVMKEQPVLEPEFVGPLEPVLQRCLAKDPDERFQTARDLKWALQNPQASASGPPVVARVPYVPWAVAALAVLIAAGALWVWLRQPAPQTASALRFSIEPPPDTRFVNIYFATAVSPDGRLLVFAAQERNASVVRLWLRPLNSLTARELPGTEGGNGVFWSWDSKSIGFVADGKLKRVDVLGGSPQVLCDASGFEGGSWSKDGVILFSSGGGLRRIPEAGGTVTPVTNPDASGHETARWAPFFLPDGKSFLFTRQDQNVQGIYAATLSDPSRVTRLVAASDSKAVYSPPRDGSPGHLLWLRDQTLVAQRFDSGTMRLDGDPVPVAENVARASSLGGRRAAYWISETGLLLFRTGTGAWQLSWTSRDGKTEVAPAGQDKRRGDVRISPDGTRAALNRDADEGSGRTSFNIWLYEFARGALTRLTFDTGNDTSPTWSPDGRQIAFASDRQGGVPQIYLKDSGGGGSDATLTQGPNPKAPMDWSRDGRYLLYQENDPKTGWDIWALPMQGDRKPAPVLQSAFNERQAQFSPDGKWIAYVSDESGAQQVYIQAFPSSGNKWQVSTSGGSQPRWRRDGKEIYFSAAGKIWATAIRMVGGRSEIGSPQALSNAIRLVGPEYFYDVLPDGQRFLVIQPPIDADNPLTAVSDWQAGLKN